MEDIADGQRAEIPAQVAERIDQPHGRSGNRARQSFRWNRPERPQHPKGTGANEGDCHKTQRGGVAGYEDTSQHASATPSHSKGNVTAPLAMLVGMARDKDHAHRGQNKGHRRKDSHQLVAHLLGILQRRGEPEQVAVIPAVLHQVNADHDQHNGVEKGAPKRDWLGRIKFVRFFTEGRFQIVALLGGNPTRLVGIVINKSPPNDQPNKRQRTFRNKQHAPVPMAQNPTRKGRGNDHRDREAEHPVGVGARAFPSREPVREQHQHGGPHSALRYPQQ